MSIELFNIIELSNKEQEIILDWRNQKSVREWMYNSEIISKETHFNFIEKLKQDSTNRYFLVKQDNSAIGVIYFNEINSILKETYLGLYSKPDIKRVGDILISTIIEYAFKTLKIERLLIEVFKDNKKAIELYKRFNFKQFNERMVDKNNILCMELKNENR